MIIETTNLFILIIFSCYYRVRLFLAMQVRVMAACMESQSFIRSAQSRSRDSTCVSDVCGVWQGSMHGRGVHSRGACVAGGVRGSRWGGMRGRGGMAGGPACHAHCPTLRDTVGQCAGGTHPTGIHSILRNLHVTDRG